MVTFETLIETIKSEICPDIYEKCILTACEHLQPEICQKLLWHDLYPIEFDINKHAMLLACKTGNCELFNSARVTAMDEAILFLFAIKYNQIGLIKHMVENFPTDFSISFIIEHLSDYFVLDSVKIKDKMIYTFIVKKKDDMFKYKQDCITYGTYKLTDPFVIKIEDQLIITSQNNLEIFKMILPLYLKIYTDVQKKQMVKNLIPVCKVEVLSILKELELLDEYKREYFTLAKMNPSPVEIKKFLIQCFQN